MMQNVFFTQKWEGWVGFLQVPDGLDLDACFKEFLAAYFNNPHPYLSGAYLDWEIDRARELQDSGQFKEWDCQSMFLEWLRKTKGCIELPIKDFCVYSEKYLEDNG